MKWLASVLIFAGVMTVLYPFISTKIKSHKEQKLLQKWDAAENEASSGANQRLAEKNYKKLTEIFANKPSRNREKKRPDTGAGSSKIQGIIEIDKIDLRLPIVEGASMANLKTAAGHITGTPSLGSKGNTAIAAHRSYTYGRQFNRLDEMQVGDRIMIETHHDQYQYTIKQKRLVAPTDMSVLEKEGDHPMLTLVTCHPMKNPTSRLIVEAQLTNVDEKSERRH